MRPQVILVVTLAALVVLAADLPLGEGSWPCCDNCGICNRKLPPECQCKDISVKGCHPECKKCVRNKGSRGRGRGRGRTYRCEDMLTNFCQNNCTATPSTAALLGGGVF